jgi:MFS family permease
MRERRPTLSRLGLLRQSNFRLVFIGQTVSALGNAMLPVALAFAILDQGGRAIDLAYVFGTQEVAALMLYLLGGVAADRYSRRIVMVGADGVRAAAQLVLGGLLIAGHTPVIALAACAAVQGVAGGFFNPAAQGLVPALVPADQLQEANTLQQSGSGVARIVGPALAGALVVSIGGGWAILLNGVSFAVNAAMLTLVRVDAASRTEQERQANVLTQLREGWTAFRSFSWYVALVIAFASFNLFYGAYITLGPVVAKRYLGGAAAWARSGPPARSDPCSAGWRSCACSGLIR